MKLIEASISIVAFKHLEFSFCILLFWVLPIDLAFEGWTPVEHFPGFTAGFYAAYHEVLPQVEGFGKRHQLYQLFHLLNHFLIYGGEYYTHVTAMVDQILLN